MIVKPQIVKPQIVKPQIVKPQIVKPQIPLRHDPKRGPRQEQEGAVMLVVMLVLLMVTATALVGVHTTAYEVRGAGYSRQALQTDYIGESGAQSALAWVDFYGPGALLQAMTRSSELNRATGSQALDLAPFEVPLASNHDAYRLYGTDLGSAMTTVPLDQTSLGQRNAYEPLVLVDIYDAYTYTGAVRGSRSDGRGRLQYLRATYTSRGRTRVRGVGTADIDSSTGTYLHESASDARVYGLSGPFGR